MSSLSSTDCTTLVCENRRLKNELIATEKWVELYKQRITELEEMQETHGKYLVAEILLKIERGQGTPLRVINKPTEDEVTPPKGTIYMTKTDLEHLKELLDHKHWDESTPVDWDSEDEDESSYEELKAIAKKVCTDT
tara:strand:- start:6720 stop:7130 length:411 start_codon:yes stop_codon:yes gene_type:complete